jgi:predicted Zn-dependent peptidase
VTQLSCEPEDTPSLLQRIVDLYTEATGGLTTAEVDQARNKLLGRVVLAGERPRQRLFSVGLEWAHTGRYRSVADDLKTLDGLTRDDLQRVLAKWPLAGPAATVLAGPLTTTAAPA